ncbi:MAG: hypothetical protein A4E43_00878 [Methanosaeta sp. PtaB.Bin005]|nr:MAG: hypothetical protein A4E43_00878 [Methanosaeta sp. PtaB.Bin005]
MLCQEVLLRRLLLLCHQLYCSINKMHDIWKCIPEKTADAQHNVYPRTLQLLHGNELYPCYSAAPLLPDRPNPHEAEDLGNVVSLGSHGGTAPDDHSQGFRIAALVLQIALKQGVCLGDAHLPGRLRWYGLGIDGVEISSRGQYVRHSPGGSPGGSGRDESSI